MGNNARELCVIGVVGGDTLRGPVGKSLVHVQRVVAWIIPEMTARVVMIYVGEILLSVLGVEETISESTVNC